MKKTIIIMLLVFAFVAGAATRENLYRRFGPALLEAIVLVIKDEINILRAEAGLQERTKQQMIDAVETKLDGLSSYDWMNEGE